MSSLNGPDKARYVAQMFASIAHRYDLMNRLMTGGQDQRWRRMAVREVAPPPGGIVLDLGTGTGDFLPLLVRAAPGARAVGVDLTVAMMQQGKDKLHLCDGRASFVGGDALRLPFPDDTFDGLVNGFVLRNLADLSTAFAEMRRVIRPGARVVCLEITDPALPGFRHLFRLYFGTLVPLLGALVTGHREAYTYLPNSVWHFASPTTVKRLMQHAGLRQVYSRPLALGTVMLYVGMK